MSRIRIDGWFYKNHEVQGRNIDGEPRFDTIKLDMNVFKYSSRELDTANLEVLSMFRYVGSFFTSKRVQAVMDRDVRGSGVPFFVARKTLMELEKLIADQANIVDEEGEGTL